MPLTSGHRLGSYEIVCALGAGGMGEVYRARDAKLGRDVALKILPPEMTKEPGRLERFDREARAIAALNHPHIVTIFSTEEADGVRFLTMELVDGCTLSDLVMQTGMAVPRFLDIAIPLADALAAAHQKQITHRDLKPGNVMVSNDNRVKVLDFGLARVGGTDAGEQTLIETLAPITHHGMIVGTMPYMSPEQVEGRSIDARSDLFSLGVIFYELLSGQRPFKGGSSPALMSAILRDAPPALREGRTDMPEALDRLVGRLIEKRPEDRVQTARDVFNELKHIRKQVDSGAARPSTTSGMAVAPPHNLWIAVLPFDVRGGEQDVIDLAAGLSEDIATSLARFPVFNVVAAQSTRAYKDSALDIRQIADRLGARFVIGGQVRLSARVLRVTAQLTDAASGAQLWSETYDRDTSKADLFAIQDDVTDHIVATIGDQSGVLARSMVKSVRSHLPPAEQTSRELQLRAWGFRHNPLPAEHAELREALEARVAIESDNADLWAQLAHLYLAEHMFVMNERPEALGRSARAAHRALQLDPNNQIGWTELAWASFFSRDRAAFTEAADRAIAINPRNAHCLAMIGNMLTHAGEYDRGCALTERAMTINPRHPGWLHFAVFNKQFAAGNYEEALRAAQRANMPQMIWMSTCIASAAAHLGRMHEARRAADRMLEITPALGDPRQLRSMIETWHWQPEQVETLIEGITIALANDGSQAGSGGGARDGSEVRSRAGSGARAKPASSTSSARSAVTIAVKPFTSRSNDHLSAMTDGLSEDVATNLARFNYLRVITRVDGARFVLEGSARSAGTQIRVTARLLDASTSEHIWAETFDRDGADHFSIQDELAARIAATIADEDGVLVHTITAPLLDKPIESLTIDELVLRFHVYTERMDPAENRALISALEQRLETSPAHSGGWAALGALYGGAVIFGFDTPPDVVNKQMHAADRAITLDAKNQFGWFAMALKSTLARDLAGLRDACERSVALNPLSGNSCVSGAVFLAFAGDVDRAQEIYTSCKRLIPNHQDWYYLVPMMHAFRHGRFDEALQYANRGNTRSSFPTALTAACAAGHLGRADDARAALDAVRRVRPQLLDPEAALLYWRAWFWNEGDIQPRLEGLRRALALTGNAPATASQMVDRPASDSGAGSAPSVAVLPFAAKSPDDDTRSLADGLTDDIAAGLSKFGYLRVLSRSVTERGGAQARFAIEGSVRRSGATVRTTVTLVDTQTAGNLWTNSFDRSADSGAFSIQDDVASAVVATVGDQSGVLVRAMASAIAARPIDRLSVAELVIRYHLYLENFDSAEHGVLRDAFERALEREPRNAEGWACLAMLYEQEHGFGFNRQPDALGRQRRAAQRAVELDSRSQQAWMAMATVHCFARDREAGTAAIEHAITINPLNADMVAFGGLFLSHIGAQERGAELAREAMRLKPHHSPWYHFPQFTVCFVGGRYEDALREIKKVSLPRMPTPHLMTAAAAGHLGRTAEAKAALAALSAVNPALVDPQTARAFFTTWLMDDAYVDSLVDGLGKAIALTGSEARSDARSDAGSTALSVAVLPLLAKSADEDSQSLADGLTDDITAGLSKFGYLRVLSRGIAERLAPGKNDSQAQARYLIEGTVRRSGTTLRITLTLVDTQTGANLWTNSYDRNAGSGTFSIQDDVASAAVATIGDQTGVLMRSMAAATVDRPVDQLTTGELVVRYHLYAESFDPAEHARLRDALERALEREPRSAEGWACLSLLYEHEHSFGFNPQPDSRGRERRAAERAHELDPNSQQAWIAMAGAHFFARDREALNVAVDRAVAINPLNADLIALGAIFLSAAGEHDRATPLVERAARLKPHHAGWYYFPLVNAASHRGDYQQALALTKKISMPRMALPIANAAAYAGHLGLADEARASLRALRAIDPRLAEPDGVRAIWSGWIWSEAWIAAQVEGFIKAKALEAGADTRSGTAMASDTLSTTSSVAVSVIPFTATGDDSARVLADAISSDLMNGLARFPYIRVIETAAAAAYRLEGAVRTIGNDVRVNVRLVETTSGAHVWTDTYQRDLATGIVAIVDDVASRIAATTGDAHGTIFRAFAASATTPQEAARLQLLLRALAYFSHPEPVENHTLATLVRAVAEREPKNAQAWSFLALLYLHQIEFSFDVDYDAVLLEAQRAVERARSIDSTIQIVWLARAVLAFVERDAAAMKAAIDRSAEINPLHTGNLASNGCILACAGETQAGAAMVRRATALNPNHPGWYRGGLFLDAYQRGSEIEVFGEVTRLALPFPLDSIFLLCAAGRFKRKADAEIAAAEIRRRDAGLLDPERARIILGRFIWPGPLLEGLMSGFVEAVNLVGTRSSATHGSSIAILPFSDLSEKKDQDWFCDGIAEDIMNALAPLPGLRVAARASAFSFRGKSDDLGAIGDKLNVHTVLEGSVRRAGDRVRITSQLSDARLGKVLWSERFDRELKDIFDVQDEIARAIVDRLRVSLGSGERLVQKRTGNMQAYELLLQGRTLLMKRGPTIVNAITCFEQAIALDPNLGDAHAALGDTYRLMAIYGLLPAREVVPKAKASLERALAIDPNDVEALATLANIAMAIEWDFARAAELSERAETLDPTHVRATVERGITVACAMASPPSPELRRFVRDKMDRGLALDPLSPWVMAINSMALTILGEHEAAIASATRARDIDPGNFTAHWARVVALTAAGRDDDAGRAADESLATFRRHPLILAEMAAMQARHGDAAAAEVIFNELQDRSATSYIPGAIRATAAASAGRMDDARQLLVAAIDARDAFVAFYKFPAWGPLRADHACMKVLSDTAFVKNAPR